MSNVSLMPVPSEPVAATCTGCGAALVADQRYCLACGQPCSPVRLAFLDVLQERPQGAVPPPPSWATPGTIELGASGYVPVLEPGPNGWLRRYSGLLALFAVLLMCLLVGLLVGHWVTQGNSKAPAKQVVEIKGLSGIPGTVAANPAGAAAPAVETPAASKATAKEEAEESKEAAKETKAEKAPPPKPVTVTPTKLKKLTKTTGKQHQEEINALGAQPIETG